MTTDTELVRTHPDQPPVAVRQRAAMTPTARVTYLVIALLGGFAWTMIAVIRGEQVNSVWFVLAAVLSTKVKEFGFQPAGSPAGMTTGNPTNGAARFRPPVTSRSVSAIDPLFYASSSPCGRGLR